MSLPLNIGEKEDDGYLRGMLVIPSLGAWADCYIEVQTVMISNIDGS